MKKSSTVGWTGLIWASIAICIGALIYELTMPYPKFSVTGKARADQLGRIRVQTQETEKQQAESLSRIQLRIWEELPEVIGPKAMAGVTASVQELGLKLSSFRPQKAVEEGPLTRIPYVISVEGEYPAVVKLVNQLEEPTTKLVVNSVQLNSADGDSSTVRATIGVWAMRWTDPKRPKSTLAPIPKVEKVNTAAKLTSGQGEIDGKTP